MNNRILNSYNVDEGRAIYAYNSSILINSTSFTNNTGGVIYVEECIIYIYNTSFTNNNAAGADSWPGVVIFASNSSFNISNSKFAFNRGNSGGVILTGQSPTSLSQFNITNCIFTSNSARIGGVLRAYFPATFVIINSSFTNNRVVNSGGVLFSSSVCVFNASNSNFSDNSAGVFSGTIAGYESVYNFEGCTISRSSADQYGGVIYLIQGSSTFANYFFDSNLESIYSNITFWGKMKFENNSERQNKRDIIELFSPALLEGGAITSFQSIVYFNGRNQFIEQQSKKWWGIVYYRESDVHKR